MLHLKSNSSILLETIHRTDDLYIVRQYGFSSDVNELIIGIHFIFCCYSTY
jgi:hypothetical protein